MIGTKSAKTAENGYSNHNGGVKMSMSNRIKINRLSLAIVVAVGTVAIDSVESYAEDSKSARIQIDEVIVTATRREESLQDTPMSINAFSANQLAQSGVVDIVDLQFLSAGLQIDDSQGQIRVNMRGIGTNAVLTPLVETGVAMHRDGVYLSSQYDQAMGFFDIERIEVLRGPQGNLYGRNATGGSINVITKAPTESFEAGVKVGIGNYDLIESTGYLSGPIIENKLLGRLAVSTRNRDGFTPNYVNGDDYDDEDYVALRGKLQYSVTDDFTIDLTAEYARDNSVPISVITRHDQSSPLLGETLTGVLLPTTERILVQDVARANDREFRGISAKLTWDIPNGMTFTSLTSYRDMDRLYHQDVDKTAADISDSVAPGNTDQFSQEFVVSSADDQSWQWLVGASYLWYETDNHSVFPINTLDANLDILETTKFDILNTREVEAYAVFGEASYDFTDKLAFIVGGRYSYEENVNADIRASPSLRDIEKDDNWSSFSPKLAITYAFTNDLNGYATISQGFRAGDVPTDQLAAVDPEKVINYEAGIKSSLYDGRVMANLSLFYMDYSDLQVEQRNVDPITNLLIFSTANAAESTIQGFEFETQVHATDSFSIDGNVAYLDATYEEWPGALDPARGNNPFDVSGNRMSDVPEWVANWGFNYTVPAGDWGSATFRGEYSYKSDVFFTPFENERLSEDSFSILNARLTFRDAEEKWQVAAWIKNITDEEVTSHQFTLFSGLFGDRRFLNYLPPRTYGLTFDCHF